VSCRVRLLTFYIMSQPKRRTRTFVGALRDRFGDHQLAAAYRSHLKARVHTGRETLQEFAAAVEQLAHRAFIGLPVDHIQTEAAHAFIDGILDREVKQHLLLGGACTLNEARNQALRIEAARATASLREVTIEYLLGCHLHHPSAAEMNDRYAGNAENPDIFGGTASRDHPERRAKTRERGGGYRSRQSNPLTTRLRC
jgi:hypothetical protein